MTPALMILGTASHAGKSLVAAGLGRIFSDAGIRVAPFKAQNMSLNSAATPDGREIGRAQALQAEACRAVPCAEMNPILIKPCSEGVSQIVVLGRVWGQVSAADYHERRVEDLFPTVLESYRSLSRGYDLMLIEGAGSPAEINLREHDIVNMRMAHAAEAACVLVGDIDRGGVFASLYGTMALLEPRDRARIRGFLINKFRGEVSLLRPGIDMMEQKLGIRCAGVVPFLKDLGLEEEDSVAREDLPRAWTDHGFSKDRRLRIAVIALPYMANFTDFDALRAEPSVSLAFLDDPAQAEFADVVILPGTKQTIEDLDWIRRRGFAGVLETHRGSIVGICGGLQMLGLSIDDPAGVESGGLPRGVPGLGRLAIRTVLGEQKTVRRAAARVKGWNAPPFRGYEIHMGQTIYEPGAEPFAEITREGETGALADGGIDASGRVWGSYLHGLFDQDEFRHDFLRRVREERGLGPPSSLAFVAAQRERSMNRWAEHLRRSIDLDLIRGWIEARSPLFSGNF